MHPTFKLQSTPKIGRSNRCVNSLNLVSRKPGFDLPKKSPRTKAGTTIPCAVASKLCLGIMGP
jgi:hypothetical protein